MLDFFLYPYPLRAIAKQFIKKFGSYEQQLKAGVVNAKSYGYPNYAYCMYHAAYLAKRLGIPRISAIEFGVAEGRGLVFMEYHAEQIEKLLGVKIDVYGFDGGFGLPQPQDYRDMPFSWQKGSWLMDVPKLKSKLKKAKLVLGDVRETYKDFFEKYNPAPIGMIAYDLDFYSSTTAVFKMLEADEKYYLPRLFCYFDDISGNEIELFSDYTGERLAITEFNDAHQYAKFCQPHYFVGRAQEPWYDRLRNLHFYKHSRYNDLVNDVPAGAGIEEPPKS